MKQIDHYRAERSLHEERLNELRTECEAINKKIMWRINKIKKLDNEIDSLQLRRQGKNWDWLLEVTAFGEQSESKRAALEKLLPRYGYLRTSGYYYEINQLGLQICLYRDENKPTAFVLKKLTEIAPHLKPHKDGWANVDIFDRGLSEYAHYVLQIQGTQARVVNSRYRIEILKEGTLAEMLTYIQKHLYYQVTEKGDD